jgi:hypothetical protein
VGHGGILNPAEVDYVVDVSVDVDVGGGDGDGVVEMGRYVFDRIGHGRIGSFDPALTIPGRVRSLWKMDDRDDLKGKDFRSCPFPIP